MIKYSFISNFYEIGLFLFMNSENFITQNLNDFFLPFIKFIHYGNYAYVNYI